MDHIIRSRMDEIDAAFDRTSLDQSVAISVNNLLRRIRPARNFVLADDAYENFALSYLKREVMAFRDDRTTPEGLERREEKLCTCRNADCPLKRGELPEPVRQNAQDPESSLDAGILAFKRDHTGHPAVLDELSLAWAKLCQDVEDGLTVAWIALSNEERVEDLPDDATGDLEASLERIEDIRSIQMGVA